MKLISIVLPCYNEELNIPILHQRLVEVTSAIVNYDFEFIFIDNCSTDETVRVIEDISKYDERVKAIVNLSNFGTIRSPAHGLFQAQGDAVITMSTDLQDPPELIHDFLKKYEEGYHVVAAVKSTSDERGMMWYARRAYYKFIRAVSDSEQIENFTGFGLYDKRVIAAMRNIGDTYPYIRGLIAELGFKVAKVEFHQPLRIHGESKQREFMVLYDYAMLGITTQSKLPLRWLTLSGLVLASASFILSIVFLVMKIFFWEYFPVGVSPILVGMFFFSSVQLFFIGILGEYVMLIYTKVANRPLVIEDRRINFK
jgi:glycosyltransferase involved in cell wall biosynthesis